MTLRTAFLGNDPWSVPTLEALAGTPGIRVEPVITNPPRAAGRGSELRPTAVARAARALNLSLVEAEGVNAGPGREALAAASADAIVVVAYGHLLDREVLTLPRLGCINVHFSMLPRWRGASPVQRAILEGDETTGVSVMLMDEGLDTGPVLGVRDVVIGSEDAGALGARMASVGATLLVDTLLHLDAGHVEAVPQDVRGATHAPRIGVEDRTIRWDQPADAVVRRVRALAPKPGADTTFRGGRLKVLAASEGELGAGHPLMGAHAGTLSIGSGGQALVRAGVGVVVLEQVAPAGRSRMSGSSWARGARLGDHELLG